MIVRAQNWYIRHYLDAAKEQNAVLVASSLIKSTSSFKKLNF